MRCVTGILPLVLFEGAGFGAASFRLELNDHERARPFPNVPERCPTALCIRLSLLIAPNFSGPHLYASSVRRLDEPPARRTVIHWGSGFWCNLRSSRSEVR